MLIIILFNYSYLLPVTLNGCKRYFPVLSTNEKRISNKTNRYNINETWILCYNIADGCTRWTSTATLLVKSVKAQHGYGYLAAAIVFALFAGDVFDSLRVLTYRYAASRVWNRCRSHQSLTRSWLTRWAPAQLSNQSRRQLRSSLATAINRWAFRCQ